MDFEQIVTTVSDVGVIALLVFIIYSGMKKWWVWGWHYKELREFSDNEINFWRNAALRALNVSEAVMGRDRDHRNDN